MAQHQQASPSGGVIFYKQLEDGTIQVYLSERIEHSTGRPTGRYSIYGGFAECEDFVQKAAGTVQNKLLEVYRECVEEIGDGFTRIVPKHVFVEKAEFVCSQLVRVDDKYDNKIHDAILFAFKVTDELECYFENDAKATDEQLPAKPYSVSLPESACVSTLLSPYTGHELVSQMQFPDLTMEYAHEKIGIALLVRKKSYEST